MTTTTADEHQLQAESFLRKHGLVFRAIPQPGKPPPWSNGGDHGIHYRVTIERARDRGFRLSFPFWDSLHNRDNHKKLTAYGVLACIGSDCDTPDSFEEFCNDYGQDEDSRKTLDLYNRVARFAARLRAFFSEDELTDLMEIQ